MIRILIVEDEKPISDLLKMSLLTEGYHCTCAFDGKAAADLIEQENFDLVLLDIMLPQLDGYELLDYIRFCQIPTIFLTAKAEVADRVKGLKAGAEDYITKPFEIAELLARVETVLRRFHKAGAPLSFGGVSIEPESRRVTKDGLPVDLTAKEFDLLLFLARNPNRAVSRAQIYAAVWGGELGDSRTVDLHVQRLRKKLSLDRILVPIYKVGYRLEAAV